MSALSPLTLAVVSSETNVGFENVGQVGEIVPRVARVGRAVLRLAAVSHEVHGLEAVHPYRAGVVVDLSDL